MIGVSLYPRGVGAFPLSGGPDRWAENLNLTSEQVQTLKNLQRQFRQELIQIQKKNNAQANGTQDLDFRRIEGR